MKRFYFATILLSLFLVGCKPEVEIPTVITQEVADVTTNSVKVSYDIVDDGGQKLHREECVGILYKILR